MCVAFPFTNLLEISYAIFVLRHGEQIMKKIKFLALFWEDFGGEEKQKNLEQTKQTRRQEGEKPKVDCSFS
jgi:hypothetical protein